MIARNFLSVSLARVMIQTMRGRAGAVLQDHGVLHGFVPVGLSQIRR